MVKLIKPDGIVNSKDWIEQKKSSQWKHLERIDYKLLKKLHLLKKDFF